MQQRDSLGYTLKVAVVLCVACSLVVSAAAVGLKKKQDDNKILERKKNILDAAGLAMGEYGMVAGDLTTNQINELYKDVSEHLVEIETGEYRTDMDVAKFDPIEAAQKDETSVEIKDPKYDLGEPKRETIARIYFIKSKGSETFDQVVLPVYGKGLWSTLRGFLAVKSDLQTIQGLSFYEHKETPGLGGEVDNKKWKAQWENKLLFNDEGGPAVEVAKGTASPSNPYAVDGLSGATITSRGVTNLLRYWVSEEGFGPFLKKLKENPNVPETSSETNNESGDA